MKKRLRELLPPEYSSKVYNSYDIIGNIAIIRLAHVTKETACIVAEAIMSTHKNVKTVMAQLSPVNGDFRLRKLTHVAGENRTDTVHKESGCLLAVDIEKCYFSPRLFRERMRIARLVQAGETIVNMFAGVGSFSVIIAKHSNASKIYSIDINPVAIEYMKNNVRINGVYGKVIPVLADAREVIHERLRRSADRVLMPLPERALEYLPHALSALKDSTGYIHYYDFEHAAKAENPVEKVKQRVVEQLETLAVSFQISYSHIVRTTGPNWHQIVLDISVKA